MKNTINTAIGYVCIISMLFSCNSNNSSEMHKEDYLLDSDYFEVVKFIPLETNNESLIARVSKILMHQDLIFILDKTQGKFFIFNENGKFISSLKSSGSGPDELRIFTDFIIDYDLNRIEIFSNVEKQKLIADFYGNVLAKERLPDVYWQEIALEGTDYLIYQTELAGKNVNVGLSVFDEKKGSLHPLIVNQGGEESGNVLNYPSLTNSKNGIGYLVPPTVLSNEFKISFHSTHSNISEILYTGIVDQDQEVLFPVITKDFQTVMKAPGPDAINNSLARFEVIYGKKGVFRKGNYAVNDLYNFHHQIKTVNDQNQIVSIHYMEQVFDAQINEFNTEVAFKANGISPSKDPYATDRFQQLIKSQGVEGNPVITLFRLKE